MNIKKNGISIFVEGNEGGLPVLFIHGFPFDHSMWVNQISKFSADFLCVSYDVRGLGDSNHGDGQHTMELFVDDLEMVLNELRLEKPVLCGFSMGGYIALRAVERSQPSFGGLILCDTKSTADTNEGKIGRALGIQKINLDGAAKYVQDFIPNCFCEYSLENKKGLVQEIIRKSEYFSPSGIKGCLLAMAGRTDTSGFLQKIELPVLILCGEEDNLSTPDVMMGMADMIHDSEFRTITKAGHLSPLENPDEVNKYIAGFLKKLK